MNIIARGTELFNITDRKYRAEIHDQLSLSDLSFSPVYKVFIENYFVGRGKFKKFEYFDNRFNKKRDFLIRAYRPQELYLLIYELFSIKEIIDVMSNKNIDFNLIDLHKTIPIGECDGSRLLLVGIDSDNLDKIFIEDESSESGKKLLAQNIFDFVSEIEIFYEEKIKGFKPELFYKNIKEDFWRIKE